MYDDKIVAPALHGGKAKMADETAEIDINGTDEGGRPIRGTFRVAAGMIHVTLSDGTNSATQLDDTPAPTMAKIILQELDRKRRGVG